MTRTLDATPPDVAEHEDVYEPADDSWLLLKAVAAERSSLQGVRALDIGTGTGIAAVWLAREGAAHVVAVDVNPHAVTLARANATKARVADRIDVVRADLATAVRPRGLFDVVTFNAPYLPSEPEERVDGWLDRAFHGGDDGVAVAERFVAALPELLTADGHAFLVLSDRGDVAAVTRAAGDAGLTMREVVRASFFFERVITFVLKRG